MTDDDLTENVTNLQSIIRMQSLAYPPSSVTRIVLNELNRQLRLYTNLQAQSQGAALVAGDEDED